MQKSLTGIGGQIAGERPSQLLILGALVLGFIGGISGIELEGIRIPPMGFEPVLAA